VDVEALFKKLDANTDGSISKDELIASLGAKSSSTPQPASSSDSSSSTSGTSTTGTSTTGTAPSASTGTTVQAIYVVSITAIVQYQTAAKAPASPQVGTRISAAA
jgi:hypothetical protein